ncbi:MAG: adenosine deaminase [Erysipelotrichaceae bacterium]|jgi:adenosine deaminase|nr:adenosine deaminase [Erysipelotrichaceae bacterium]
MIYPKVELHCHMDGAMPYRLFARYCREDGLVPENMTDEEWISHHVMTETMTLTECMGEFAILTGILQKEERLEELTYELLKDMYAAGTRLAEIRFSPQSHINEHMSMDQAVAAVLRGRKRAMAELPDMVSGIILCMMNLGLNLGTMENNKKTVELAAKYKDEGVVAIDLAGDETATPIEIYAPLFEYARSLGVHYTIHAGESGPASNVAFAIRQGEKRIGHGIHSIEDEEVVKELIRQGVVLEVSVTSNYFSRCVSSIEEHPIRKLWDKGVMININTDDPGLMGITLQHEYDIIAKHFGFTEKEFILSNLYAARSSFCPDRTKIIEELTRAFREC